MTTPDPERTRHPVAAKRSPSGVTTTRSSRARERSIASSHPSTRTARPTRRVEDGLRDGASAARPHVAAHRFGAAARRQRRHGIRRGGGRLPRSQHRSGDAPVAQRGQSRLGRTPTVDNDRGDTRAGGRLEGRVPPRHRSRRGRPGNPRRHRLPAAAHARPPPADRTVHVRALRPAPPCDDGPPRPRPPQPVPTRPRAPPPRARRSASRRLPGVPRSPRSARSTSWATGRPARPRPPTSARARPRGWRARRGPLAPGVAACATSSLRARTRAMAWSGASPPSTVDQRSRSVASSASSAATAESRSARPGAAPAASSASAVASSAARCAASASSVETTSTSAAASSAASTARPRSRSTPESPLARSTRPCTRPRALARSSSRRDDSSAVVDDASASSCSSDSCSSRSSSRHTSRLCAAIRRRATRSPSSAPARYRRTASSSEATDVVRPCRGRLSLQGSDLAPHLSHQIAQALQVLRRGGQPALGPLPPAAVLQHTSRLFDDGPAILGPGVEHRVQLSLADDHVLLTAHTRVAQQLLDVEQPAGCPVDGVLAVPRPEQRSRDGDLREVDGQLARMRCRWSARPRRGPAVAVTRCRQR